MRSIYFKNNDNSLFLSDTTLDKDYEAELRKTLEMEPNEKFEWMRIFSSDLFGFDKNLTKEKLIE